VNVTKSYITMSTGRNDMQVNLKSHFTCGRYYKNITIVNDTARAGSKCHHNLEHQLRLSIMLLDSSIMLLELAMMLPENMCITGITHEDRHMTIVMCL
jgi:hypothetical protein